MKKSFLIKPASGNCNLNCKYCFNEDILRYRKNKSKGFMSKSTSEKIIKEIFKNNESHDEIEIGFQGGEPTIVGLKYFQDFLDIVEKYNKGKVKYSIQTNGTNFDDDFYKFLKRNDFLVGISLDISENFHNKYRVDKKGRNTFHRVLETLENLKKYNIRHNILSVLTKDMAKNPDFVYKNMEKLGEKYFQFIPCLSPFDSEDEYSISPEDFFYFYDKLFFLWKDERKFSIQFFDSLINRILYQSVGICGLDGKCKTQNIIEADGSFYPCDFYTRDEDILGNLTTQSLDEIYRKNENSRFFYKEVLDFCKSCNFFPFCNGGCKRMDKVMYVNKDRNFCGYKAFLNKNGEEIISLIKNYYI